ncbi:hypothetical protein GIY62_11000 [Burkholderia plantarii]|uniref:hypothetical protein n=1 Tax=Burkholderia plantarii TaxID=41899 RepID=UPI00272A5A4C|nr:hypothetical protein [Burkholderia plantarii]WLE57689.1 hypothetical protein GIY62_11000 [Burkholderia plantarii]
MSDDDGSILAIARVAAIAPICAAIVPAQPVARADGRGATGCVDRDAGARRGRPGRSA